MHALTELTILEPLFDPIAKTTLPIIVRDDQFSAQHKEAAQHRRLIVIRTLVEPIKDEGEKFYGMEIACSHEVTNILLDRSVEKFKELFVQVVSCCSINASGSDKYFEVLGQWCACLIDEISWIECALAKRQHVLTGLNQANLRRVSEATLQNMFKAAIQFKNELTKQRSTGTSTVLDEFILLIAALESILGNVLYSIEKTKATHPKELGPMLTSNPRSFINHATRMKNFHDAVDKLVMATRENEYSLKETLDELTEVFLPLLYFIRHRVNGMR